MTALLLILMALPGPQEGEITHDISFGLERHYRAGFWTYARITLENRSTRSTGIEATVVARCGDQTFETRSHFAMGPGSRKTRFVYFRPDAGLADIKVYLEEGGKGDDVTPEMKPHNPVDTIILVAPSPSKDSRVDEVIRRAYGQRGERFQSIELPLGRLPDRRLGLDPVRTLILPDGGIGVRNDQADAIRHWVAAGGDLVIGGGRTAAEIGESPLLEMLPVLPGGTTRLDALPTTSEFLETSLRTPLHVTTGSLLAGEVILWENEVPLIFRRGYGQGTVTFLAFDPDALVREEGGGVTALWTYLIPLEGGNALLPPVSIAPAVRFVRNSVQKFTQGEPIPLGWIILFVLCYVVVIGPVDYLVLKRLGKLEWTWFTFTISVVVFSALAYFGSVLLRGQDLAIREMALLDLDPATGWRTSSTFLGVYSPQNRRLGFRGVTDDTTLGPLRDPGSVYGGAPVVLEEPPVLLDTSPDTLIAPVRIWTPRSFRFRTCRKDRPLELTVEVEDHLADVVVQNPFDGPLEGTVLIMGERVWRLGTVPAGGTGRWREVVSHDTLLGWMRSQDIPMSENVGSWSSPRPLRGAALALTLREAKAVDQTQMFGTSVSSRSLLVFPDLSLRKHLDDGGAIVLGWLENPPAAYVAEDWSPTQEDRIGLVRMTIRPK
jgi:hypothetical protein